MKKILFILLLVMVGVFSVTAAPLHPPGENTLEIAMSDGYGIATPDTVLSLTPLSAEQGSLLAKAVITDLVFPARPQDILTVFVANTGQRRNGIPVHTKDFYLLC